MLFNRNIPVFHRGREYDQCLGAAKMLQFIDEMIQEVLNNQSVDIVAMQEHAIATLACKASVKGNTYLTTQDMQTIVDNLMRCDNPYVCPHGRPTIIFYSDYEIEKLL